MVDSVVILKLAAIAFFSSLFCIYLLSPLACRIGLVDTPGGRKWHEGDTPLVGGLAIFLSFCFASLALPSVFDDYYGLLAGGGLLVLIGVLDDFRELSSKLRLLGHLLACLFLILWGGKIIENLGNLFFFGDVHLHRFGALLTIFAVIGFINAMNMMDGQDGLAGGVALTQTLALLFLNIIVVGHINQSLILVLLSVLLSVFLFFNMPLPWRNKAAIFLGDTGSTFIAFAIAWFAIDLGQSHVQPITILYVLALPLFDLVNVCIFRINRGISPLTGGRDHLHHILHMRGFSAVRSTLLLCLFSLSFAAVGIALDAFNLAEGWMFLLFLSALVVYLFVIKILRGHS